MTDDYVKSLLSSGEVLLIDARQHWMALLRFAIRPLLLAGLALLLALVNQWLRFDTLGFINDLIHWVLIIAIVLAIVWLPIDVVRWMSRRYLLTNRRAMRMDGVLRKHSFDSSLEQIQDIGLTQSFLGRQLGYADLTLFTASGTPNETYQQLRDGLQFKKAVLDAKEAIRAGQPLEALPEGFVVRGGTNEASRRAFGGSPEPTLEAGAGLAATTVVTSPVDLIPDSQGPDPVVEATPRTAPVEPLPGETAPSGAAWTQAADSEPAMPTSDAEAGPTGGSPRPD